jgi:hypothetical protein
MRRSGEPATHTWPSATTTSSGAHSSISAPTSRALCATSRAERAMAGPATAATRLAIVPRPKPTRAVSPPRTITRSIES